MKSSADRCRRNYLDRNAIAQARLNDLEEDLGLVGSEYNTCISILFVGEWPFFLDIRRVADNRKVIF